MDLAKHYLELWRTSLKRFEAGKFDTDQQIRSLSDNRRAITLIIRIPEAITQSINGMLNNFAAIEPDIYYYPEQDMHITVLPIFSNHEGFSPDSIDISAYQAIIDKSLKGIKPFEINLKGITASPSCIMVQGFLPQGILNSFRDQLRANFKLSALPNTIDQRYTIKAAHSTVARFIEPIQNKNAFIEKLKTYRCHMFGAFTVNQFELVYTDWYMRKQHLVLLDKFSF